MRGSALRIAVHNVLNLLVAGLNLAVFLLWTLALTPWQRVRREGPVWDPAWSNVWGGDVKDYWRERLGCDPVPLNATAPEAQRDAQRDCYDAAFLWWSMPLLIVLAGLLHSAKMSVVQSLMPPCEAAASCSPVPGFLPFVGMSRKVSVDEGHLVPVEAQGNRGATFVAPNLADPLFCLVGLHLGEFVCMLLLRRDPQEILEHVARGDGDVVVPDRILQCLEPCVRSI